MKKPRRRSREEISNETKIGLFAGAVIIIGFGIFLTDRVNPETSPDRWLKLIATTITGGFLVGSLPLVVRFLTGPTSASVRSPKSVDVERIVRRILKEQASTGETPPLVGSPIEEERTGDVALRRLEKDFEDITGRLLRATEGVNRRAATNLVIGLFIGLVGVAALFWTVVASPERIESTSAFLFSFVPRLSLILFVELFAYFFLSLYRSSLAETKYFHNELTNLQVRYSAFRYAAMTSSTSLPQILNALSATERNHVLRPGETTVELEQVKAELAGGKTLTETIPKVVRAASN